MESAPRIRVAVCAVREDRLLLVEHLKDGRHYWLLPGGGVEPSETLREALQREVREECGLEVKPGRLVVVAETIEPQGKHLVHLVYAGTVSGDAAAVADPQGRVAGAAWHARRSLGELDLRPRLAAVLEECWVEGFAGPLRDLGNIWVPG